MEIQWSLALHRAEAYVCARVCVSARMRWLTVAGEGVRQEVYFGFVMG